MQGMELIIKSQKALGGKLLQEISAMGNTAQKMVFDGKDGYMMMMGNKTPLPEDIKTALLKSTSLFEELDFAKTRAKSIWYRKIGGEDSYVIKDGKNIYYYSVNSGLKPEKPRHRR